MWFCVVCSELPGGGAGAAQNVQNLPDFRYQVSRELLAHARAWYAVQSPGCFQCFTGRKPFGKFIQPNKSGA